MRPGIEFRFLNDVPAEVREPMATLLREHEWILPGWVEHVVIDFLHQDRDRVSLSVTVKEEYRTVDLDISPNWLLQPQHVRSDDVVHEFAHVILDPLMKVTNALINASLEKGSALEVWAQEQLRLAVERSACDLEAAISRRGR